jgi:CheY-like chemotaxis protein
MGLRDDGPQRPKVKSRSGGRCWFLPFMDVLESLAEIACSVHKLGDIKVYRKVEELQRALVRALEESRQSQTLCAQLQRRMLEAGQTLAGGAYDARKFGVLYVDDDPKSLQCFAREYGKSFRVLTAADALEGWQIVNDDRNQIGIVMADSRMPNRNGRWLLEKVRQNHSRLIRILVSTFPTSTELLAASAAANSGAIYGFILQPWEPAQLEHVLKRALEHFMFATEMETLAMSLPVSDRTVQ